MKILDLTNNEEIDKFLKQYLVCRTESLETGLAYNILSVENENHLVVDCQAPFTAERTMVSFTEYAGRSVEELLLLAEKISFGGLIKTKLKDYINEEKNHCRPVLSWSRGSSRDDYLPGAQAGIPYFIVRDKFTRLAEILEKENSPGIYLWEDRLGAVEEDYHERAKLSAMYLLYDKIEQIARHFKDFSKHEKSGNWNMLTNARDPLRAAKQYITDCINRNNPAELSQLFDYAEISHIRQEIKNDGTSAAPQAIFFLRSGKQITPALHQQYQKTHPVIKNYLSDRCYCIVHPWGYQGGYCLAIQPTEENKYGEPLAAEVKKLIRRYRDNKKGRYQVVVPEATEVWGEWARTAIDFNYENKNKKLNLFVSDRAVAEAIQRFYPEGSVQIKQKKQAKEN